MTEKYRSLKVISFELGKRVSYKIILGDLIRTRADAIVCPSNPTLGYAGVGGIQTAICEAAGIDPFKQAEAKAFEAMDAGNRIAYREERFGLPVGYTIATDSGNLKGARHIVHVNGMNVDEPTCDYETIKLCTTGALIEAGRVGAKSLATPLIGTGLWGVSMEDSLRGIEDGFWDYLNYFDKLQVTKLIAVVFAQPTLANKMEILNFLS